MNPIGMLRNKKESNTKKTKIERMNGSENKQMSGSQKNNQFNGNDKNKSEIIQLMKQFDDSSR